MDTLNNLASQVFESRESYTTNDYLVIMNILKEQYHRLNGDLPSQNKIDLCECAGCTNDIYDEDLCWDCYEYKHYNEDMDSEGYLSDYIGSY